MELECVEFDCLLEVELEFGCHFEMEFEREQHVK